MTYFSRLDIFHALAILLMQRGEFDIHTTLTMLENIPDTIPCQNMQFKLHALQVSILNTFTYDFSWLNWCTIYMPSCLVAMFMASFLFQRSATTSK